MAGEARALRAVKAVKSHPHIFPSLARVRSAVNGDGGREREGWGEGTGWSLVDLKGDGESLPSLPSVLSGRDLERDILRWRADEFTGGSEPLGEGEVLIGVDNLSGAGDNPKAGFPVWVSDLRVAALFQAVRDERRFLRSLSHWRISPSALATSCASVTASGRPSLSSTSASSASSGARLASTMSQKAGVFGGGAFGSKPERSSSAR